MMHQHAKIQIWSALLALGLLSAMPQAVVAEAEPRRDVDLVCQFQPVPEVQQPAATVTLWAITSATADRHRELVAYEWSLAGEEPSETLLQLDLPSRTMAVQGRTADGIWRLMTVRFDGQAVLSTHDARREPDEIVWSAAIGVCQPPGIS